MNKTFLNYLDCLRLSKIPFKDCWNTDFWWGKKDKQLYASKDIFVGMQRFSTVYLPAYTDSDLNEVLPHKIVMRVKTVPKDVFDLVIRKTKNGKYQCVYENQISGKPSLIQVHADTEVKAKAEMIIFLAKRKLLKDEEN